MDKRNVTHSWNGNTGRAKSRAGLHYGATLICCMFLALLSAHAQFTSGIEGTVSDATDAVIPNAAVTLSNPATGSTLTVQTTGAGYYRFPALSSSIFKISVSAPGFETLTQENIKTEVALTSNVNLRLQLGTATTEVTVADTPPPIQLNDASVSGTVGQREVQELPLPGRNFYSLVVLTPGVTGLPSGGSGAYAQSQADIFNVELGVNLNAGGMRTESNSFLIDSAPVNSGPRRGVVNINPNAESVQELRVQVNNYTAEYGGNAGATVNVITRQGANRLHGSLDEFHTDNALVTRSFFSGPKVPVFRRNEFGGSIGGPIYRNHTFFFGSVDALRASFPSASSQSVYTPAFIDFLKTNHPNNVSTKILTTYPSSVTTDVAQQTTGAIAGVDCTKLASPSQAIQTALGPVPCSLAVVGSGNFSVSSPRNGLQWNARVDQSLRNGKDRIYANFYRTTLDTKNPSAYSAFTTDSPSHTFYGNVAELHIFAPNVLNQVRYSYTRVYGIVQCAHCDVPSIGIGGTTGFGGFGPFPFVQNNYEGADSVTWTRGAHNIRFGGSLTRVQSNANGLTAFTRPYFGFDNALTFAADAPSYEGGLAASLTTGQITGAIYNDRRQFFSFFWQDDWKVRPNLTLNLGLRYESFGNFNEVNPDTTNIVFQGGATFEQQIANAKVAVLDKVLKSNLKNNFGPKFGFAYDPIGNGRISVRGGFGVNYDVPSDQVFPPGPSNPPVIAFVNLSNQTAPFVPIYGLGTSATAPYGFPTPVVQTGLDAKNGPTFTKAALTVMDPNLKTEYSENYSLGVQGGLKGGWVAELDYIGAVARHQYAQYEVNRFNGDLILNKGKLTRLNTSFGGIQYTQSNLSANYNGMTAAVRNRGTRGLSTQIAYTFGKALDQASSAGGGLNVVDPLNLRAEYGAADFDVRNRLSISLLYEIPGLKSGAGFVRGALGGWEIGDVTILQSGTPFSVYNSAQFQFATITQNGVTTTDYTRNVGGDYNGDGYNYDRPNAPAAGNNIRGASRKQFRNGLFACNATVSFCGNIFAAPVLGQQGNIGRNTYRGPGYANSDFSLLKNTRFKLHEDMNLQFRAETQNVFNRTNLSGVVSDLNNASQFGKATNSYASRQFQFGARLIF